MQRFTDAVRSAIANENWYAALYLALTIPDICARLESDDGKTKGPRYRDWFERYVADRYRRPMPPDNEVHVFLGAGDCYALRCAMLHEGSSDITTHHCREALERFHFTATTGNHLIKVDSALQLDVSTFCEDICQGAEHWFEEFQSKHPASAKRAASLVTIHTGASVISPGVHLS